MKYELVGNHSRKLVHQFPDCADDEARYVIKNNVLTIASGTLWDGPSYLARDTPDWMWGSLVHDVLYRLIVMEAMPIHYDNAAHAEMRAILKTSGMGWLRRSYSWLAVRIFGRFVSKYRIWKRRRRLRKQR